MTDSTTSTVRITGDFKLQLRKVGGEMTALDGKEHSFEDIIKFLLEHYRSKKTLKQFLKID